MVEDPRPGLPAALSLPPSLSPFNAHVIHRVDHSIKLHFQFVLAAKRLSSKSVFWRVCNVRVSRVRGLLCVDGIALSCNLSYFNGTWCACALFEYMNVAQVRRFFFVVVVAAHALHLLLSHTVLGDMDYAISPC